MAESLKKADYSTPLKKKRYVESERQRMLKASDTVDSDVVMYIDGVCGDRRQKAILNCLGRAEEEFRTFGLTSVVEQFVRNELVTLCNYNSLDADNDLRIGAALWILDKLRENGTLRDAFGLLPDVSGNVDAWYLPLDFAHPCYDQELISSVIHLISRRYSDKPERNVIITGQNACGRKPCEAYEKLMDLLPEQAVQSACEAFRQKQWELVTRFMKGQAYYDREIERSVLELEQSQMIPGVMNMPFAMPGAGDGFDGIGGFGSSDGFSAVERKVMNTALRGKELIEQSEDYFLNFDNYLQMDKLAVRREAGRQVAEALDGFQVDDPCELCFALFYLIDHGDDAPWLLHSGASLMLYALRMLPWHMEENLSSEEWDEQYEGLRYDRNGWLAQEPVEEQIDYYHEKHGKRNLAQIIYDLCRTVVPTGLHPFEADRKKLVSEGMSEETARKLTDAAELMFLYEFQAHKIAGDVWDDLAEEEEIAESETAADISPAPKLGGYWGRALGTSSDSDTQAGGKPDDGKSAARENERLKGELDAAKKQLNSLREALAVTKREASIEITRMERELKPLQMEHRELADLRELVFNREAERPERLEKTVRGYSYPYETKKRTIVFGGHDSFLKAIRPLLPDVRFVDAGCMTFSTDLIRNADVVWIQNNCISHSQYWTIVRECKRAGVQMRYFGYASAEKCAEQLVEWDQK